MNAAEELLEKAELHYAVARSLNEESQRLAGMADQINAIADKYSDAAAKEKAK